MIKFTPFFFLILVGLQSLTAQTIFGKWKTIDDRSGSEKSIVKIYEKDGKVYGTINRILENEGNDTVCTICEGKYKNKPLIGVNVIKGLKKDGNYYEGGKLFDPEKGKEYKGKIWLNPENPDELMVRGYIAFFYRTQIWLRVKE